MRVTVRLFRRTPSTSSGRMRWQRTVEQSECGEALQDLLDDRKIWDERERQLIEDNRHPRYYWRVVG